MQTYRCNRLDSIFSCFIILCAISTIYFGILCLTAKGPDPHPNYTINILGALTFFLLGGFGLYIGCFNIYHCLESIIITDSEIVLSGWGKQRCILWSNVATVKTTQSISTVKSITDHQGNCISIYYTMYPKAVVPELSSRIESHLVEVVKKQSINLLGTTIQPSKKGGVGLLILSLMGLGIVIGLDILTLNLYHFSLTNIPLTMTVLLLIFNLLIGGASLSVLCQALFHITLQLTLAESEIKQQSLYGSFTIEFSKVTSIFTRLVKGREVSWNVTTIKDGSGHKIILTSRIEGYEELLGYLQSHTPVAASEHGNVDSQIALKQDKKNQFIAIVVASLIISVLGISLVSENLTKLNIYHKLHTSGERVNGIETGWERINGSHGSATYFLKYSFLINGKRYNAESPVSWNSYELIRTGTPISVIYNPQNPHECMSVNSTGESKATSGRNIGLFTILFGIVILISSTFKIGNNRTRFQKIASQKDSG